MKKVVTALLIVTVLCGAVGIAMAEGRLEVAQTVQDYSDKILNTLLSEYKAKGTLSDDKVNLATVYYVLSVAAKDVALIEAFYQYGIVPDFAGDSIGADMDLVGITGGQYKEWTSGKKAQYVDALMKVIQIQIEQ